MTKIEATHNSALENTQDLPPVDAANDQAIYILDDSGHITNLNLKAQRSNRLRYSDIVGRHFSALFVEEEPRQELSDRALEIAAREGVFRCEGWRAGEDGSRVWSQVTIDPIQNQAGNILGFVEVIRDLSGTDSRVVEVQSEDHFGTPAQRVTDYSLCLLDDEGRISRWSLGARKISGYEDYEILGQNISVLYSEEDRLQAKPQRALQAAERDGAFEVEGWRLRKDATLFKAKIFLTPIRAGNGSVAGFAEITRDLTEAGKAENTLRNAREALFQSQKMEAIGQLTGGVAHDFNNILMAVLGGLEIVQRRLPIDPQITPLLENAIQAAQRGRSLTKRMLAFARRHELKPETTYLPALIAGMTDLLHRSVGPSNSVEVHIPPDLEAVYIDPNQLELAILNLVMNARDAAPDGGCITLTAHPGSPCSFGREYVCLSISANAKGVDNAALAQAKEDSCSSSRARGGAGVRLSMVDGLAEQAGGSLVIKNRKDGGTVAELWLPIDGTAVQECRQSEYLDPVG